MRKIAEGKRDEAIEQFASALRDELSRLEVSLGDVKTETENKVSVPALSKWFSRMDAPHHEDTQRAVVSALRRRGVSEELLKRLCDLTVSGGGRPSAVMTGLIEAGFAPRPETHDGKKKTLKEAVDMHETLTDKAAKYWGLIPDPETKLYPQPFDGCRSPKDVYQYPEYKKLLEHLRRVVIGSTSLAVVKAPTGAGKSTMKLLLKTDLRENYDFTVLELDLLDMARFDEQAVHRAIFQAMGDGGKMDAAVCMDAQQRSRKAALSLEEMGKVVLLVDQAEDLKSDGVVLLKRLVEWSKDWKLLLRVVVFGQPQIENWFKGAKNRQVKIRAELCDLPQIKDAWGFVSFCLRQRGRMTVAEMDRIFPKETREAIQAKAEALCIGKSLTPRALENIAAHAMNWAAKMRHACVTPDAVDSLVIDNTPDPTDEQ